MWSRIWESVRHDALFLAAAAAMTAIVVSPLFLQPRLAGDAYRGIDIVHVGGGFDENGYLIRAKELLEGHALGNPVLREGKNENPDYYFTISDYLLVKPFVWLGAAQRIDVVLLYGVENTIGVFVLLILMYAYMRYVLGASRTVSAAGVLAAVGAYSIIYDKAFFGGGFNLYIRAVFPYVSSLFFFCYLLALGMYLKRPSLWRFAAAGTLLGASVYIYFYAWTFAFAFAASFVCIAFVRRDWSTMRRVVAVAALGALVGAWNVWRILSFVRSPSGAQFSYFSWSETNHLPVMSVLGVAMIALYALWLWRCQLRSTMAHQFILAAIIAGWVALNQQIITGHVLQYGHFYWYFITPLVCLGAVYILNDILPQRLRIWFLGLVIVVAFVNAAGGQYRASVAGLPAFLNDQRYVPALAQLQREPYGVVLTSLEAPAFLVPIYTSDDVFWANFASLNANSLERMKDTLLLYLYLHADAHSDPAAYIRKTLASQSWITNPYLSMYINTLEGYYSGLSRAEYLRRLAAGNDSGLASTRDALLSDLVRRYQERFSSPEAARAFLAEYGVTYILWDRKEDPEWDLSTLAPLVHIDTTGDVTLYRVE